MYIDQQSCSTTDISFTNKKPFGIIYSIFCLTSKKLYIGQTTNSLREKIRSYKNDCKFSKNPRPIILAMRKYGFESFIFKTIAIAYSRQELDFLERKLISEFNTLLPNGYNVELGGNSEGKHSEETKRKISSSQLGSLNHMYGKKGSLNSASKKVIELTTGKIFESASLAAEALNCNFSHICATARGSRASHNGYVFRYLDNINNVIIPDKQAVIKSKKLYDSIPEQYKKYIAFRGSSYFFHKKNK